MAKYGPRKVWTGAKRSFRRNTVTSSVTSRVRKAFTVKGDSAPPAAMLAPARVRSVLGLKPVFFKRRVFYTSSGGGTQLIGMTASNTNAAGVISFKLNDIASSTDITNLFDQYAIVSVKLTAYPRFSESTGSDSGVATSPGFLSPFAWALDVDPTATAPASLNAILEYPTAVLKRTDQITSFKLQPLPALPVVGVGAGGGMTPDAGYNWIDSTSPAVPHAGVVWYLVSPTSGSLNIVRYDVCVEFNIAARNSK